MAERQNFSITHAFRQTCLHSEDGQCRFGFVSNAMSLVIREQANRIRSVTTAAPAPAPEHDPSSLLLKLPRELRDEIIDLVALTPESITITKRLGADNSGVAVKGITQSDLDPKAGRYGVGNNRELVEEFSIFALARVNWQLRLEVESRVQWLRRKKVEHHHGFEGTRLIFIAWPYGLRPACRKYPHLLRQATNAHVSGVFREQTRAGHWEFNPKRPGRHDTSETEFLTRAIKATLRNRPADLWSSFEVRFYFNHCTVKNFFAIHELSHPALSGIRKSVLFNTKLCNTKLCDKKEETNYSWQILHLKPDGEPRASSTLAEYKHQRSLYFGEDDVVDEGGLGMIFVLEAGRANVEARRAVLKQSIRHRKNWFATKAQHEAFTAPSRWLNQQSSIGIAAKLAVDENDSAKLHFGVVE